MAGDDRGPRNRLTDQRVIIVSIVLAVVVLVLFLAFDYGFPTATDATSGGPDADYSAPMEPEETEPTTPTAPGNGGG